MKKLLVLFIVFGFISTTNAGIIDLQIRGLNGQALTIPVKEITINPSDMIDFAITFTGPGSAPIDYNFGNGIIIHSVPEPGTVLLLGLGGLFLRRKK